MIVTYLSEESERANVLARLGFSYGIGMVVGPTLGGYITTNFRYIIQFLTYYFTKMIILIEIRNIEKYDPID